jgi:hypothetical protein
MKQFLSILSIVFFSFGLSAQSDCVDFEDFESSQNWIKEINKLDVESRKDSILNRLRCERFFRNGNIEHFELIFVVNGYPINNVSEYRDSLLNQIKAENFNLFENNINAHKHHGLKGHKLGFLAIYNLNKPIIDNIETLTIRKIERIKDGISIRLKSRKIQEFTFKIEDFENKENYKIHTIGLRKRAITISIPVDSTVKVITITDSENNSIVIIH